jgi:sugar-phosphatase
MHYFETPALLFDMDGTIIDSCVQVDRVWSAWCERSGYVLEEIRQYTHGVRTEDTLRRIAPELDIAAETAWIEALDLGGEGFGVVAGVDQFLECLPETRWAVVTSAPRLLLEARFASCGLALPRVVVSAETVRRGKPSPEPYLQAAEKLGVDPRDCIVFEDAPAGMASALAAGCQVVLVGGLQSTADGVIACVGDYSQLALAVGPRLRVGIPSLFCNAMLTLAVLA